MKQPESVLPPGTKIRTHAVLGDTRGMLIGPGNVSMRKADTPGEIRGVVGGYGGDVYWVQHPGDVLFAPYCFDEFERDDGR